VTGVWWLAKNNPEARTAVICAQDDSLGRPSVATYKAAFEAHGIEVLDTVFFDLATTDFAPVMANMLARNPDILCLDTSYADFVHPLCEQAFQRASRARSSPAPPTSTSRSSNAPRRSSWKASSSSSPTSTIRQLEADINFENPRGFFEEYSERWPGEWSAVSWEYASILELWRIRSREGRSPSSPDRCWRP
jgi:branched-chain amino acid transport system substrate-binding protein